jgi:transposase-like protein
MHFFDFVQKISSLDALISYLQDNGLIRRNINCEACDMKPMNFQKLESAIDKGVFRCSRCKRKKSLRAGSFFEKSKLDLRTVASIVYFLCADIKQETIASMLNLNRKTVMEFASLLREEYSKFFVSHDSQLGGEGVVVQIDESLIAKQKTTRNNHARPVLERWVFGIFDTQSKVGCIQLVENRSSEVLLPIIQQWVRPGSIICSDGWAAYNGIRELGYEHRVVVHENYFVDPFTGTHTNNVENYWQRCKRKFKWMYGTYQAMIPSYLDEFMWIERYGIEFNSRWDNTIMCIRNNYSS